MEIEYIVISYPDNQDSTSVMRFDNLKSAIAEYQAQASYGATPLLAKTIRVIRTSEEIEKEEADGN